MTKLKLTIVGSGDAFCSGGRSHTCFHVTAPGSNFLIDLGAASLPGLQREQIDLATVDVIFISHLHGDHFGGLPFAILQSAYLDRRQKPLSVIGPPGIEERYLALAEAMFAGMTKVPRNFELRFEEMVAGRPMSPPDLPDIAVEAFEVEHPSGAPSHALRFEIDGKTLSYSGDSQWCDGVKAAGQNADLLIMECYSYDLPIPYHMNWEIIRTKLPEIGATRVMLTHMSRQMLSRLPDMANAEVLLAEDGMTIEL